MKLLVATSQQQGQRVNDFCFTVEGEVVLPARVDYTPDNVSSIPGGLPICSNETVDGPCGCKRSFAGLRSTRSTTTAKVVDSALAPASLVRMFADFYSLAWLYPLDLAEEMAMDAVENMTALLAPIPLDTIVEQRETIQVRRK